LNIALPLRNEAGLDDLLQNSTIEEFLFITLA
jgi:hypothetical protein